MNHLVFFLEELSAKELIDRIMPRIAPDISFRTIAFNGKQDLEKNLYKKMKFYLLPNSYFFIVRDQDSGDCHLIKDKLRKICAETDEKIS